MKTIHDKSRRQKVSASERDGRRAQNQNNTHIHHYVCDHEVNEQNIRKETQKKTFLFCRHRKQYFF